MKPTVGRTVMYTNLGDKDGKFPPEAQAAIITTTRLLTIRGFDPTKADGGARIATWDGPWLDSSLENHEQPGHTCGEDCFAVTLAVFYRTGLFFMVDPVAFSAEAPGTDAALGKWGWPPRV